MREHVREEEALLRSLFQFLDAAGRRWVTWEQILDANLQPLAPGATKRRSFLDSAALCASRLVNGRTGRSRIADDKDTRIERLCLLPQRRQVGPPLRRGRHWVTGLTAALRMVVRVIRGGLAVPPDAA